MLFYVLSTFSFDMHKHTLAHQKCLQVLISFFVISPPRQRLNLQQRLITEGHVFYQKLSEEWVDLEIEIMNGGGVYQYFTSESYNENLA